MVVLNYQLTLVASQARQRRSRDRQEHVMPERYKKFSEERAMETSYLSQERLHRLQALAEAQGQSLDAWIDEMAAAVEGGMRSGTQGPTVAAACPLVSLVHEYFLRICRNGSELVQIGSALLAAVIDGEGARFGPLECDGILLELDPQHDGVRISAGGGRFTLTNAAALQLADRLGARRWRPTLAA
jgi:hypothetical protein